MRRGSTRSEPVGRHHRPTAVVPAAGSHSGAACIRADLQMGSPPTRGRHSLQRCARPQHRDHAAQRRVSPVRSATTTIAIPISHVRPSKYMAYGTEAALIEQQLLTNATIAAGSDSKSVAVDNPHYSYRLIQNDLPYRRASGFLARRPLDCRECHLKDAPCPRTVSVADVSSRGNLQLAGAR